MVTTTAKKKTVVKKTAAVKPVSVKEKQPAKERPAPIGHRQNPRRLLPEQADVIEMVEFKEGFSEYYVVEVKDSVEKKWETVAEGLTLAQAPKVVSKMQEQERALWVQTREREWLAENTHQQQVNQLMQVKVTAKTTDEELEKYKEDMAAHRRRLIDNPGKKMPKFKKKDAPLSDYRVMRVTVSYSRDLV